MYIKSLNFSATLDYVLDIISITPRSVMTDSYYPLYFGISYRGSKSLP